MSFQAPATRNVVGGVVPTAQGIDDLLSDGVANSQYAVAAADATALPVAVRAVLIRRAGAGTRAVTLDQACTVIGAFCARSGAGQAAGDTSQLSTTNGVLTAPEDLNVADTTTVPLTVWNDANVAVAAGEQIIVTNVQATTDASWMVLIGPPLT
jgi:hypothetical protein